MDATINQNASCDPQRAIQGIKAYEFRMETDPSDWPDSPIPGDVSSLPDDTDYEEDTFTDIPFFDCGNPFCRACGSNCECPRSPSGTIYHQESCPQYNPES